MIYFKFILCLLSLNFIGNLMISNCNALQVGSAKIKTTPLVETFSDFNNNNHHDESEPFIDLNNNGKWDGVWLAGYGSDRFAKGVHDDLWARSILISSHQDTVLFIALDCIGYLFDEISVIKNEIKTKFHIPPENILFAATHDHSAPDTIGLWGSGGESGKNSDYIKWVRTQILTCVGQAMENKKNAKLIFGKTRFSNPIEDSRPPKVINDLLLSFRAVDEQNKTIATLVNYAMHAEALDGENRLITADYPGVLCNELEKKFGGTALFFAADIGGMQSPFILFHSFWSCRRVGKSIAEKVINSVKKNNFSQSELISIQSSQILFPVDNPKFKKAIQNGLFGESAQHIAKENENLFLPADISFIKIGPAQFISVPGEMFPELGNILRQQMKTDFPFVIGLCNNEFGYIVPTEEWKNDGYEESMSLGPKTATLLMDQLLKLLH